MSTRSEIQEVFDKEFGFAGFRNLFPPSLIEDQFYPDFYIEQLSLEAQDLEYLLLVELWLGKESGVLERLEVFFSGDDIISTERVIEELGEPDHLLMNVTERGGDLETYADVLLIYDDGLVFFFTILINRIQSTVENGNVTYPAEYCLAAYQGPRQFFIFEPFREDFEDLTLAQSLYINHVIRSFQLVPPDDIMGANKTEIAQRALQEQNPCFTFPLE